MLKTMFAPHLKRHVKFGRQRPAVRGCRLQLHHFLKDGIPSYPASADYSAKALAALRKVYLNDQLGDCVIAGGQHVRGVTSGNATGAPVLFTDAQTTQQYSAIGGYVPGDDSTDQGCNEQTALDYWTKTGFADGVKLYGWVGVDASSPELYKYALWLFETLYFGIELPDAWINPMPEQDGFVWDAAGQPDPQNGHCIMGMGYNAGGVTVDTWGLLGQLTDAAIRKYCSQSAGGELYVLVSSDMLAKASQKAPNGLDWTGLVSAFEQVFGGHGDGPAPAPAPTPTPPAPVPVPAPSALQAILDGILEAEEAQLASRPLLRAILVDVQAAIDGYFAAHGAAPSSDKIGALFDQAAENKLRRPAPLLRRLLTRIRGKVIAAVRTQPSAAA